MAKYLITEQQAQLLQEIQVIDKLANYTHTLGQKAGQFGNKHFKKLLRRSVGLPPNKQNNL